MSRFGICLLIAALAAAGAGCGDDPVARVERRVAEVCRCVNQTCADAANEVMLRTVREVSGRVSKSEAERIMEHLARAAGCTRDILEGADGE